MDSLPLFFRLKNRPVLLLGSGEGYDARKRLLIRSGAIILGEEGDAQIAFIAETTPDRAEAAAQRLKLRGILINVMDRPDLCDFTLPAIIDRDPVLIAIGTSGASAGLAKALRQKFETLLPDGLGALAKALYAARGELHRVYPSAPDRRRAIDSALSDHGPLDPMVDHPSAAIATATWLAGSAATPPLGMITLILTSDDPDDLTLKQARLLGQADHIYHHSDINPAILNRARADAVRRISDAAPSAVPFGLTLYIRL